MTILASQIMTSPAITVRSMEPLRNIRALFDKRHIHHVLVLDDNKQLAGIISDRDLLLALSPFLGTSAENRLDRSTLGKTAWQLMTPKPIVVSPHQSVPEAAHLMLEHGVSCLPVVNIQQEPIGFLSWKDVLRIVARASAH